MSRSLPSPATIRVTSPSLCGVKVAGLLLKPVAPETLLARVEAALEQSSALRARSATVMAKLEPLLAKSAGLMAQGRRHGQGGGEEQETRECPSCGQPLEWIETGQLNGTEYRGTSAGAATSAAFTASTGRRAVSSFSRLANDARLRASSFYVLGFSGSTVSFFVLRSTLYVWFLNLQPWNHTLELKTSNPKTRPYNQKTL